jgi:hypothetical protein
VLSAIYLLWAYQRVALGEVTVEKNRTLPDASPREKVILWTMAIVILFMGVASPLFTRRMEPATNALLEQMTGRPQNASRPPLQLTPIGTSSLPTAPQALQLAPINTPSLPAAAAPLSTLAGAAIVKADATRVQP